MSLRSVLVATLAAVALAASATGGRAAPSDPAVRETMREIYRNLHAVLEEVARERAEPGLGRRGATLARTREALRAISDQAALLAEHAHAGDELTGFLADSLDHMASLTALRYESQDWAHWQDYLFRTTELCVACHSRRPAAGSPGGQDFLDAALLAPLPLALQAELLTATRRFDAAFDTWRAVITERLEDWAARPASTVPRDQAYLLLEPVGRALVISVRVRRDFPAAGRLCKFLSGHPGLPGFLAPSVARWAGAVLSLQGAQSVGPDGAEKLIREGDAADREVLAGGLVHHVTASAALYRNLDVTALSAAQRARILYLLALAEERIRSATSAPGETPWFPQTELLLELAILADPGSQSARAAYPLLERIVAAAFPGGLPEEVQAHLDSLKAKSTGEPAQ